MVHGDGVALREEPRRTVTVIWRDGDNVEQRERRFVSFAKGFGHYVRWNRRDLFVDPLQTEIIVDTPGPKMRRPAA